jgi:hypothetical protein
MVQANIEEEAISIILANGESATVPTGETWHVSFNLTIREAPNTNSEQAAVSINGTVIAGIKKNNEHFLDMGTIVLTEGDTIKKEQGGGDVHVNGFKVQNTVDNTPISQVLAAGDSITVPTDEVWKVRFPIYSYDPVSNDPTEMQVNINNNIVYAAFVDGQHAQHLISDKIIIGGDTLSYVQGPAGVHVSGYKVQE